VAVVNERFAKHFFGDGNPIGRKFAPSFTKSATLDIEIVGVVKDSHYAGVKQTPPRVYYIPWRQSEDIGAIAFYVRTALPPERLFPRIRQVMSSIDPNLPLEDLRSLEEQVRLIVRSDRVVLQLSSAFAVLATVLAMLGLYGVLSYSVARRTREIGIRIALGAPSGSIQGMVFREVLFILAGGLAAGLPAAAALAKFTESQLFGVKSFDAAVIAGSAGALIAAAALAGYLPARRAAHIQPVQALRQE
jgi:ABC-type antimicrobial peptide transport system permease subunit